MKKCKICCETKPFSGFYKTGITSAGNQAYSSNCRTCISRKNNPNKQYKPHINKLSKKQAIREDIIVDVNSLYILIKKVSLNGLKMTYIDALQVISYYIDLFGDDFPSYYSETEQLDIMFFKLDKYIQQRALSALPLTC